MQYYFKKFIIHINNAHANNALKETFNKKLMIKAFHNKNKN